MKRNSRKQATRIAIFAFVAADCAGAVYAKHRMDRTAEVAAELAYAEPLLPAAPGADRPAAMPANSVVAEAAPVSAVPLLGPAQLAKVGAGRVLTSAAAVHRVLAASGVALSVKPRRSLRLATVPAPDHVEVAGTRPPTGRAAPAETSASTRQAAATATDGAFANAFTLADEAPGAEHRFGQDGSGLAPGSLADLVAPREEIAPIFDKAGIAPVTGEAATVDVTATPDHPADPAAVDQAGPNG